MRILAPIKPEVGKQLMRIFHIWMVYVLLSKLGLIFSHWDISYIRLLNYDLFFLIITLSVAIFLREQNNRYVYLNLAILAFGYLLGFLTIFVGKDYAIGNDYFQYYFWVYRKVFISIITCVAVIYVPVDYLYHEKKISFRYFIALLITLPISFFYFKNFLLSHRYMFLDYNYLKIFSDVFGMNFLAIFFILLYGYLLIKRAKPIAGHVNMIMFSLLIFLAFDSLDNYYNIIGKNLPPLSQVILSVILGYMILILVDNFIYLGTEFGRFYENYRFSRTPLKIKLIPRTTFIEKYAIALQNYISSLPYKILLIIFMILSLSIFIYFYPYDYSKWSFVILIVLIFAVVAFLNILVRKRADLKTSGKEDK